MQIRDIPFEPGARLKLAIRAVDGAGNAGEAFTRTIRVSTNPAAFDIKASALKPFGPSEKLPEAGGVKVAVVDLLDKIHPVSGKMIPPQPAGYRGGNHVYSAAKKLVRLQSGRNETVCFQLNLEGRASDVSVKYAFDGAPGLKAGAMIFHHVKSKAGMLPDPLMPLAGAFSIPSADGLVPGQRNQSLVCEVFVPHDEKPGKKRGAVTVSAGGGSVKLAVELEVWNFTLPNKLSFIPEMNCYGTVSPYSGYGYYRLAHEHRVCVNRLPYGWSGGVAYAPRWNGNDFDWSEWDRRVGPVLDGSAFRDLPRKGEPVDVFYLPFNENWPVNVFDHFKPSYWVDEAFTPGYKRELRKAFASFARHCNEKGWHDTILEYYMNNKVYNRKTSRSNSAPWIFDEPVNTQDFWALRWYGLLWHQAVAPVRGRARMWYRGDVSYSQYGRNIFWGVMDLECLGGSSPQKIRMKLDEQALFGHSTWTEYGSANDIESPNVQPAAWCLSAWGKGCVGVLPWQTIGNQGSWQNADKLAVFYPHASGPKPSVRLKAFTRGQQDVEYMVLLGHAYGKPRYAVANGMRKVVDTSARVLKTHEMDAGTISFRSASPQKLWELRVRAGAMISARGPAYKRSLVEFRTPESDLGRLPDIGYCRVAPEVPAHKPKCDGFRPR